MFLFTWLSLHRVKHVCNRAETSYSLSAQWGKVFLWSQTANKTVMLFHDWKHPGSAVCIWFRELLKCAPRGLTERGKVPSKLSPWAQTVQIPAVIRYQDKRQRGLTRLRSGSKAKFTAYPCSLLCRGVRSVRPPTAGGAALLLCTTTAKLVN